MKLENQVCSLELSKKIKELGVKQKSLWVWQHIEAFGRDNICLLLKGEYQKSFIASAFTVAELGEMLPEHTSSYKSIGTTFACQYRPPYRKRRHVEAENEANARAKMLIYLIENEFIGI